MVARPRLSIRARIALLVGLVLAIFLLARVSGVADELTPEGIRELVRSAGALGMLAFGVAFVLGLLAQIPGVVFLTAALLTYGPAVGVPLTLGAGLVAVTASFLLVRGVGGALLTEVERPLMKRLLAALDRRPVRTVLVLRVLFGMSPPVNYALALSSIRVGPYVTGSVLGLVPRVALDAFVIWAVVGLVS